MFLVIASIVITGCSKNDKVSSTDQTAKEFVDPEIEETLLEQNYSYIYPLTGIGTNDDINQRTFAVMINNHSAARPQSGLHKADIVYEILAEGSITRYLALFQSELPDVVGPVRSARDYFIHLSDGYGAIYVAYGGSPEAFQLLRNLKITDYIGGILRRGYADDQFFSRANFRKAPHNVYTTKEMLMKGAEARDYSITQNIKPLSFLSEDKMDTLTGNEAKEVTVRYSNSYNTGFKYDQKSKKYQRYVNGEESIDLETETPIEVDNILIIEAPHIVADNQGRRDINLNGDGQGYLIQLGIVQEVHWRNDDGRITPYINEEEAGLVPGKTWVNVIPSSPGLENTISFSAEKGRS